MKTQPTPVPTAQRIQLAKLFGNGSREAMLAERTPAQWKRTLKKVIQELRQYLQTNIETDEMHFLMLKSGLDAAEMSLNEDDFWPGYVEGITRFSLLLMGEYPDHRRRKGGKKRKRHYYLDLHRSVRFSQDANQKKRTIFAAGLFGYPNLSKEYGQFMSEFYDEHGFQADAKAFMRWFKSHYPEDYGRLY